MKYSDHPAKNSKEFKNLIKNSIGIPDLDSLDNHWRMYYAMLRMYLLMKGLHTRPKNAPSRATHFTKKGNKTIWFYCGNYWDSSKGKYFPRWEVAYKKTLASGKTSIGWDFCSEPINPIELNTWN